jgi:hypothetical protein
MTNQQPLPLLRLRLRLRLRLLQAFILLFILPLSSHASFIMNVNNNDEDCFVVRTPKGPEESLVTGSFDLLDDKLSPDPVSLVILNQKFEHIFKSTPGARSGSFAVVTSGRVSLCVRNGIDNGSSKTDKNQRLIGVNVQVKSVDVSSSINAGVQVVNSKLTNFRAHYDYMRTREASHRELSEQTFTKLIWWSLLEATAVCLSAGAQIMLMKRFVEKRRY